MEAVHLGNSTLEQLLDSVRLSLLCLELYKAECHQHDPPQFVARLSLWSRLAMLLGIYRSRIHALKEKLCLRKTQVKPSFFWRLWASKWGLRSCGSQRCCGALLCALNGTAALLGSCVGFLIMAMFVSWMLRIGGRFCGLA